MKELKTTDPTGLYTQTLEGISLFFFSIFGSLFFFSFVSDWDQEKKCYILPERVFTEHQPHLLSPSSSDHMGMISRHPII